MNWRNMVVLYNLTVSHTLFRSVWSHTEPPSTHSEGGRVGGMIDGRPQPFVCSFQRQVKKFWCKQPWRTAGRCTQRHLFLTRALLGQNTDKCRTLALQSVMNSYLKHTRERSTALYLPWCVPPLNGPHEPRPPSNQIHRSLHPALPSLHQRIWPPGVMKDTHRAILFRS